MVEGHQIYLEKSIHQRWEMPVADRYIIQLFKCHIVIEKGKIGYPIYIGY